MSFVQEYNKILPYIDPDSPRFVDWITVQRTLVGKQTRAKIWRTVNDDGFHIIESMIDSISGILKKAAGNSIDGENVLIYQTDGVYRFILIDEAKGMEYPSLLVVLGRTDSELTAVFVGDIDGIIPELHLAISEQFKQPDSFQIDTLHGFTSDGQPMISSNTIVKSDPDIKLANETMYPWVSEHGGLEALINDYLESTSTILILLGERGTGKTTFMRTLSYMAGRKKNITVPNESALMNAALIPWLSTQGQDSLIMMEDADNLCSSRASGNHQMSALLNTADGVVGTKMKIVISTNLASIDKIDEALPRLGRTYKVLKFERLTMTEAQDVRASVGVGPITESMMATHNLSESSMMTLSDALKLTDDKTLNENRNRRGIAFN